ncbi:MAG: hypothetical protein BGO31_14080 [Bacteroidetes bacterium 43-16]|nr:MAG: hypothetical protein BGO31_14080 [Bacteroidetes bacterium 43-16]
MSVSLLAKTALLFVFVLFSVDLLYATRLSGVIKDEEGYTISYAVISVKGTNLGTSAGEDGVYYLDVPEGNATVVVEVMGYKTVRKNVSISGKEQQLDFVLALEHESLTGVVVKANAEDPAYRIMRNVIANKGKNAKKLKTFETDIYLKGKLYLKDIPNKIFGREIDEEGMKEMQKTLNLDSSNNGIIYFLEQFTKYYYKAPDKEFNKVNAVKTSGDPKGLGFATMPSIIDVYENNVNLMSGINPRGFISPAHTNAFQYYKFAFQGSYEEDGQMINKIEFWPRRGLEPTFRGTLYVVDEDWTFKQLELILDKRAQIENVDTMILRQQYRKSADGNWVIQQQVLYPVIKIFGFGIAGDFLTNYTHAKVNEPIDEQIFKTKLITVYDSSALSTTNTYWEENRPFSLTKEEVKDYAFKDSTYTETVRKTDSLYNATQLHVDPGSFLVSGAYYKKRNNQVGTESLINSLGFNTVEGLVVGLNPYWKHGLGGGDSLNIVWKNHYGFANKQFQSTLHWNYLNVDSGFRGRSYSLWGMAGRDVFQINTPDPIIPLLNTYTTLFAGYNFMKLYQATRVQLGINNNLGNGFSWNFNANFEDRQRMENNSTFSFSKKTKERYTVNNPDELPEFENHKAFILNLGLQYQPGWKFVQYPKYKSGMASTAPVFELNYIKGIKGIFDSKSDFDRWQAGISDDLSLKLQGIFRYRLTGGGFLNKNYVGNPDMFHLFSNEVSIASPYLRSFQTAPYFSYSHIPSLYGQLNAEWHLNGFLTNKIPGFKKLNWHLVLSGNGFYTNQQMYYGEYGIGLENIGFKFFKVFRVDYYLGKGSLSNEWRNGFRLGISMPMSMIGM